MLTNRDATVAGRLLALSLSDDAEIAKFIVTHAAEYVVTKGIPFATGYIEGCWYVGGNNRTAPHPFGLNVTWKAVLAILNTEWCDACDKPDHTCHDWTDDAFVDEGDGDCPFEDGITVAYVMAVR